MPFEPCFFATHESSRSVHGVEYTRMVRSSAEIHELYRGFDDIPHTMFNLSTVMLGLFGHRLPERVTIKEIMQHKLTNLRNDAHMFAMTTDNAVAQNWGRNTYISIDPRLIQDYLIDVHRTYTRHQYNFPARMLREKEHVALAVLSCNVKSITLGEETINNPFYIEIEQENREAVEAFKTLYLNYLCMLREIREKIKDADSVSSMITAFLEEFLAFYDSVAGEKNPFNQTVAALLLEHPEFMTHLLRETPIEERGVPLREIVMENPRDLLMKHAYAKSLIEAKPFKEEEVVTCYDDPYSYSQYD